MKLLRHVLSHMLLIFIIFSLVSVYYYRHHILPDDYAGKIDTYAEKIHPYLKSFARNKKLVVSSETVKADEIQHKKSVVEHASNTDVDNNIDKIINASKEIAETTVVADNDALQQKTSEKEEIIKEVVIEQGNQTDFLKIVEKEKSAEAVLNVEVETKSEVKVNTENEEVISTIDGTVNEEAASTDKEGASENKTFLNDILLAARVAFHNGNLDEAVSQYNSLIELDNDEADYYGELGNVYYAKGQWNDAGIAYYEAATRLIENKRFAQVHYLHQVIKGLDAQYAEKLQEKLLKIN